MNDEVVTRIGCFALDQNFTKPNLLIIVDDAAVLLPNMLQQFKTIINLAIVGFKSFKRRTDGQLIYEVWSGSANYI